ncbi:MAG: rhodanese-like domain-containing protein [Gammaproteobacteria bacterium]|nr:rhodanese-like domain-containing protein [Gammaproteobacteria bacterium]
MQEMSPQQVHEYLEMTEKSPLLLDVREHWEYEICHIEGSELIPMQTIPNQLDKLDPEQEIIVICHHGVRSRMVGQFLEQARFKNIRNLSGGVAAWAQEVDRSMPTYF